jgi:hypothetical protein
MIDKAVWKARLHKILSLDNHPGHIAAGFAVGVFISFTPFFGIHTPMAIVAAFLLRLNKLTCVTGAWVNTPLTVVPALGLSHVIGRQILGGPPVDLSFASLSWSALKPHAGSLILGSSVIGFVAAFLSYALCYWLVVRFRRKDEALALLTRESEDVGEDLEEEP